MQRVWEGICRDIEGGHMVGRVQRRGQQFRACTLVQTVHENLRAGETAQTALMVGTAPFWNVGLANGGVAATAPLPLCGGVFLCPPGSLGPALWSCC